ncbi:class I adenylate-forming enzyme family protein [Alloalcanivorax marinus]|uniref:class I adenylate-forming enzyme family protein n=1 Tax=Alloalcanivorax marinus TaxID=1177169 RepID=UPI00195A32A9|nr:class I adenylate-forming enzyme family protein [Alloalcanivorax marinus]
MGQGQQDRAPAAPGTGAPMSFEQAAAHLVGTDPRFALTEATVRGQRYTVFRNTPFHLRDLLRHGAPVFAGRDVLVYQQERWDHEAVCADVRALAAAMATELGVRQGDRVALAMRNYPELPILILAVAALGAVAVPMNAWWGEQELAFAMADCGARVLFADQPRFRLGETFAERLGVTLVAVRDVPPGHAGHDYRDLRAAGDGAGWPETAIDTDDDAVVLYSSGSTGRPKGVQLTHRGMISAVYSQVMVQAMGPLMNPDAPPPARPPASLIVTPLFHVTALNASFLQGMVNGATMTLMYKWDADEAVRLIEREQVTRFVGVPTQSAELLAAARRAGAALESLNYIGAGGAKRPAAQVGQLAEAFPAAKVGTGWGMTETNALGIVLAGPDYVAHPDAAGRLNPPLQEMRLLDEQGRPVPPGQVGELAVRSAANMRGYLNQPEATADTLRDGWLLTGDLARVDDDGLVYIVDRRKSIILRGGENVSCLEVEGALHHHPAVAEAGVFPVPDERLGEAVGAAVWPRAGATVDPAELAAFLRGHLARFKIPDHIWVLTRPLPRGATDKIDRRALRAACLDDGPRAVLHAKE